VTNGKDRLNFHTTLNKDCLKHIKKRAFEENIGVNDVLEELIHKEMDIKKKETIQELKQFILLSAVSSGI
jgi:hypothetical protein